MIPRSSQSFTREKAFQNGYDLTGVEFLERLEVDFADLRFIMGKKFTFRPPKTVVLGPQEPFYGLLALHEVSHAICGHKDFKMDVERLKMENQAWEKARELAFRYDIEVDEEFIQGELDTYRDWLHQKSRCPECGLTRFQTPDARYHCPRCENFRPSSQGRGEKSDRLWRQLRERAQD